MENILTGIISALWLGIMTSISPCPLATNIAAVSFLSKKVSHPVLVLLSGMAYSAGRMFTYVLLGLLIIKSLLTVPETAQFLQKYMTQALGPILIITGLILFEAIKIHFPGLSLSHKHHSRLAEAGIPGAFLLGAVFALAFCPVSAALFFGSLIPLAIKSELGATLPFIYGVGTGVPVLVFAFAIAAGVTSISHWFHKLTKVELYMRRITAAIFVLVGLYYTGIYIFKLF